MTRIILNGCGGRMGRVIASLAAGDPELEIAAGIDVAGCPEADFPVFTKPEDCDTEADVIVDFSNPAALEGILSLAVSRALPLVLCTTGLSEAQIEEVKKASKKTAVLRSANMSLGINTIIQLLKSAAQVFCPAGFDVEVVEAHHSRKLDAPSGTAIALADAVNEAEGGKYTYVYNRSDRRQERPGNEIGISSVRGGTIPGTHDVIFAGPDELIEIKHTAYSRAIFGNGALSAAKFLTGKPAGMYDMQDVIREKL